MPDSIDDDELLYRKIPVSEEWYEPDTGILNENAFRPHKKRDKTGLSLSRAQSEEHPEFQNIEDAAKGRSPHGYFLAVLRVGDLRAAGIEIVPQPIPEDKERNLPANPGHVELSDMNSEHRDSDQVLGWKQLLAKRLTLEVVGPFHIQTQDES